MRLAIISPRQRAVVRGRPLMMTCPDQFSYDAVPQLEEYRCRYDEMRIRTAAAEAEVNAKFDSDPAYKALCSDHRTNFFLH